MSKTRNRFGHHLHNKLDLMYTSSLKSWNKLVGLAFALDCSDALCSTVFKFDNFIWKVLEPACIKDGCKVISLVLGTCMCAMECQNIAPSLFEYFEKPIVSKVVIMLKAMAFLNLSTKNSNCGRKNYLAMIKSKLGNYAV